MSKELIKQSVHSPGVVQNNEKISRFILDKFYDNNRGQVLPAAFQVNKLIVNGISSVRISYTDSVNDQKLINDLQKNGSKCLGKIIATCSDIRSIIDLSTQALQAFYILDTATANNKAHADVIFSDTAKQYGKSDQKKLRYKLMQVFSKNLVP